MSFFMRNRVEEDLEKIRKANLPPKPGEEQLQEEPEQPLRKKKKEKKSNGVDKLEKGDLTAMILAVFSIIGPYILIFLGVFAIIFLIMWLIF